MKERKTTNNFLHGKFPLIFIDSLIQKYVYFTTFKDGKNITRQI